MIYLFQSLVENKKKEFLSLFKGKVTRNPPKKKSVANWNLIILRA